MMKNSVIATTFAIIMLISAGCAGWGDDGPTEPEEETDGNGEAQEEVDPSDSDESDAYDTEDAEQDSDESERETTDDEENSQDDSGSEITDGESGSDGSTNESDEVTNSDGSDDASSNGENEEEVHSLYVEATSEVTLERNWESASTTREPTDGSVEFSVIEGEYTLSAEGYEDKVIQVEEDITLEMAESEEMNTLTVEVDDINGDPIEGATIEAVGADDPRDLYYEGETDADGIAEFEVAQNANYILTIEADEYEDRQQEISLERDIQITLEQSQSNI